MRNPPELRSGGGATSKMTPCCSKVGLKRGPWMPEEDEILAGFIRREGEGQWRTLPKRAGLLRCCKSCRLRWMNYLRPHLKRGPISPDEEDLILRLHRLLGNRWSLIAGRIPGRTDNEIKNYWNTHLAKKLISQGLDPRTHKPLINYNPNPNNPNNSSSFSDHPAEHRAPIDDVAPNPNPNLAASKPPPPPAVPFMIMNQEASTSYNNLTGPADHGIGSKKGEEEGGVEHDKYYCSYNDEMFSSFLDSLIMSEDVFQQPQQANDHGENDQMFQGQSIMTMTMMQPMGYGSDSQGFDHSSSVWESDRFHPRSWNLDPEDA